MTARDIDQAAVELRTTLGRAGDCAAVAALAAAVVPLAWAFSSAFAVAVGIGAAGIAGRGLLAVGRRRRLLEELALEPQAIAIPEVRAFGRRLTSPASRARLAKSLRAMVRQSLRPASRLHCLFLVDRVAAHARELEAIARDLGTPAVRVDPVAAARCRWLLTNAVENPLYDRRIPEEDLSSILCRIRAGLERPVASRAA